MNIGYINYFFFLLLGTGLLILTFDKKAYGMAQMNKEYKAAHWLGWLNVSIGMAAYLGNWVYQKWFW